MIMDALEYVIRRAEKEGASQAEAFFSRKTELQIRAEKGEVKLGERRTDSGIGIRLAMKRKGGYSLAFTFTTDFSEDSMNKVVTRALKTCRVRKPDPDFKSFPDKKAYAKVTAIYDKRISKLPPKEAIDLVSRQMQAASADKRAETVRGLTFLLTNEIAVANSLGVSGDYKSSGFYSWVYVLAKEADSSGAGFDDYSNCFWDEEKPVKIAENALELAIQQLHPRAVKGGKMDLVMAPDALSNLLIYTLIQEVRADQVQRQRSPLVGKLNQQIASEVLTMKDDGRLPRATGSKIFDDEGAPTTKTPIIEKGVLRSFLYDTYTAKKENRESTGNAARNVLLQLVPKYRLEPFIGPTNIVIEPGTNSKDEIVEDVKNGIITKDFIGAHTSNPQTGAFSMAPYMASKIENGEITHSIKEAMIGGDILSLLKNVKIIGNDVKQVQFYNAALIKDATLIAPTILIGDVSVSA
ncbi:MAG: TldD/PmbA family protein [Candidatus Bathyarchaeia archaeon]